MGQDKGLMILKDKPMILLILEKLEKYVDEVLLVLRNRKQLYEYQKILKTHKYSFDLKFFQDEIKSQGPLSGIYTGLSNIKTDYGLVLPCDSPFISGHFVEEIFKKLEEKPEDYDAVVPFWGDEKAENFEPLHAIYHKQTAKIIDEQLLAEKRDVKSFIRRLNTLLIRVEKLDPSLKSFKNLNQVEDLNKIENFEK